MTFKTIPETKTNKKRIFTITDEIIENVNALQLIKNYRNLRPPHVCQTCFINYRHENGHHKLLECIHLAKYHHLPNANSYTGHAFRRSSASLLVEAGADILMLKNDGGWNPRQHIISIGHPFYIQN
ncbi:hypothetical protein NQ317_008109 [Molorchus minor]|uniref:Tyr recombinase domain-containing protein n=1 Tax=Molorchus minor TaxID=1323400 RepID=A0ABQ9JC66_9CUCU|nr:hypothetical protein NQ317_008109 [Molorchus minor]